MHCSSGLISNATSCTAAELPTDIGNGAEPVGPEVTGDPGNQMPRSLEQDEPEVPTEPVTPKKDKELKGHKKKSEVYLVECQVCGRYFE